jgi:hypothetical protein
MTQNLGQIIRASGGIFSRRQALDCGETDRTLAAAVRAGTLVRLRRGFYTPADIYATADPSAKHVLYARAALAGQCGRVALTGVSAAALHGFDIHDTSLEIVHLVRLDNGSTRRRPASCITALGETSRTRSDHTRASSRPFPLVPSGRWPVAQVLRAVW